MAIPLVDVDLTLRFTPIELRADKVSFFQKTVSDLYPKMQPDTSGCFVLASENGSELMRVLPDQLQLSSLRGISFAGLRDQWGHIFNSFTDVFEIPVIGGLSLGYYNEIPLEELRSFQKHLAISFDMPRSLKERIEFFRSEFTYRYDFGEIHVWLQPDYDETRQSYCIQLSMESRHTAEVNSNELIPAVQKLHEGIKDVFRQILSEDYISQLPQ